MKELIAIQSELKAPKNQYNTFGKYNYRSAEDVLEALKPLLSKHECQLTIHDEIEMVGERIYVKAVATICKGESAVRTTAFAREEATKKGMDGAQITGSASSYARKYALNGLFLIDDTKDPDSTNKHGDKEPFYLEKGAVIARLEQCKTEADLKALWGETSPDLRKELQADFTAKKETL